MEQIVQIAGAIAVLTAFVLAQFKVLRPGSVVYLTLNLVGSAVLAWVALANRDWGFLLLEGVWALVSAVSLARVTLRGEPATEH
ncbi:hypothetical protein AB0M95_10550 [Sphaerisporangium sp. NPDC051017]|uniref:CBU_0592 family membrane protein n=1 Tax=Sphaerisporangium sp. NPDC051017 TaxID=3154636 RepID=UPI00343F7BA1